MTRAAAGRMGRTLLAFVVALPCLASALAQDAPVAKKSPPAAVRQFRDAVAFQDRGVYELAADEWQKFLQQFPQDPLVPKARHYLGVCQLLEKQYDAALATFRQVIEAYPKSELADASYLNLGLTQYSLAQAGNAAAYEDAAKTFGTLIERFPQSKTLPEALYYLGESLYASDKKTEARDAYAKLADKFPAAPLRADGLYALAVTLQDLGQTAEAGATFDRFLKDFPQHALRAEVMLRRAETLFSQGQFASAEAWFQSAAQSANFPLADVATLRQAASLLEQKKIAEAAALYATIPTKFPQSAQRAAAMLAAGNCFYLIGNLDSAAEWLTAALSAADPGAAGQATMAEAAHWLARVYLKQGKPAEALAAVERAGAQATTTTFAAPLALDRADAIYELPGRRGEALALYADLVERFPQHPIAPQALYMAAFTALGQGDYTAAQSYCERFAQQYPDAALSDDIRAVAAEAALQLKQYAVAEKLYAQCADKRPMHADAARWRVRRGLALFLDKRYSDVVTATTELIPTLKSPDLVAQAHYLLGSAQLELQQPEAAQAALTASLTAEPKGKYADEALLNLAAAQRMQNQLPAAMATLDRLAQEYPQSKLLERAYFRGGEYATAAGDFGKARGLYQQMLETWPNGPLAANAQYGLAWTQLAQRDYAAAAQALDALLARYPGQPVAAKALYARALAREQLQDYSGAQSDAAAFLATEPSAGERLDAIYIQGLCAAGLQQFDQAAEFFRSILTANPQFASADKVLYELAWALKSADKSAEANETFDRLAREYPSSPLANEALFHLGEHAYQQRDFAVAAQRYRQVIEAAGKSALAEKAWHKLGWTHHQQGQFAEAAKTFADQKAAFPEGELAAEAQFMVAESLFGEKKYEAARDAYRQSQTTPPTNPEQRALAALHLSQALSQLKDWSEASKVAAAALSDFPESAYRPELLYEAGWALQNQGSADEALKHYEQVAAATDREVSARAQFMMGEILFDRKQYKEAVRHFFKVAYGYGYPKAPEALRVWQANAAYEAARCFEGMNMMEQAKKSYREVIEQYPDSDKQGPAKNRLQSLGAS